MSVWGTGKAIEKAIAVAVMLQQQGGKKVSFHTGTVTVLDEYESNNNNVGNDDDLVEPISKARKVSSIEIRIYVDQTS